MQCTCFVKRKYEVTRLISIILRMTMVAYVEKARKTSVSIMCTTSAIFIQIVVGSKNRKQKVNIHI